MLDNIISKFYDIFLGALINDISNTVVKGAQVSLAILQGTLLLNLKLQKKQNIVKLGYNEVYEFTNICPL